jgi:hypothetical protein
LFGFMIVIMLRFWFCFGVIWLWKMVLDFGDGVYVMLWCSWLRLRNFCSLWLAFFAVIFSSLCDCAFLLWLFFGSPFLIQSLLALFFLAGFNLGKKIIVSNEPSLLVFSWSALSCLWLYAYNDLDSSLFDFFFIIDNKKIENKIRYNNNTIKWIKGDGGGAAPLPLLK